MTRNIVTFGNVHVSVLALLCHMRVYVREGRGSIEFPRSRLNRDHPSFILKFRRKMNIRAARATMSAAAGLLYDGTRAPPRWTPAARRARPSLWLRRGLFEVPKKECRGCRENLSALVRSYSQMWDVRAFPYRRSKVMAIVKNQGYKLFLYTLHDMKFQCETVNMSVKMINLVLKSGIYPPYANNKILTLLFIQKYHRNIGFFYWRR